MVCIYCGSKTQVVNSRLQKQANNVWRRRTCLHCQGTFTTHEAADLAAGFMVVLSHKLLVPFNRDKLFVSIYESCKHRETALHDAAALTQTIINKLIPNVHSGIIEPGIITTLSHEVLSNFDTTAATVYIAYHKQL